MKTIQIILKRTHTQNPTATKCAAVVLWAEGVE